jgi:photosystem II stability/assembly factor-like uncharacterized protein
MGVNHEATGARTLERQGERAADRARARRSPRGPLLFLLPLVAVLVAAIGAVALSSLGDAAGHLSQAPGATATVPSRDTTWQDVGLGADDQIVFSRGDPRVGYSCGIENNTIMLHATRDGGMSWQPVPTAVPPASEICLLAVDDVTPQQLALLTVVSTPDPCLTTACTPTPCAGPCQPCIDYCAPPPQIALYRSADGGVTWKDAGALPEGAHFAREIAFAGGTLYAWTDTWPTLLAASVAGGPLRLVDLGAYFPAPQNGDATVAYGGSEYLHPLGGQLFVPIPTAGYANRYIVTGDGGASWTRRDFTLDGDPVELRTSSGLDGRTLMGERLHGTGFLALSTDGGITWHQSPAPYPDFTQSGTQCYVSADDGFLWINPGQGVYRAGIGATSWTLFLDVAQMEDITIDLVSYDANGHLVALWGREGRTKWVVHRLP